MSFKLPQLNYNYDALEPYFDKITMEIHHTKHHQTYINNANKALENFSELVNLSVDDILKKIEQLPDDKKNIIRNNVGGHANHSLFWKGLKQGTKLQEKLIKAIEREFNSVDSFKEIFEKTALSCFGSGWIWLIKTNKKLAVVSTANQDNPLMGTKITGIFGYPILGLDVWEHAYYLKYQNRRQEYIKAFWNVVNWDEASFRFSQF